MLGVICAHGQRFWHAWNRTWHSCLAVLSSFPLLYVSRPRTLPWILFTEIKTISQIKLYINRNKCDTKRNVYKVTDISSFSIPTSPLSWNRRQPFKDDQNWMYNKWRRAHPTFRKKLSIIVHNIDVSNLSRRWTNIRTRVCPLPN